MNQIPFTRSVIVICAAVFLLQVRSGFTLIEFGALWGPAVIEGEVWRLLTAGLLHNGLTHLAFNMFALFVLGRLLEPIVSTWFRGAFAFLFVGSLLGGSVGALLVGFNTPAVGASGAVFGLLGAAVTVPKRLGQPLNTFGVMPWLILNLLFTFLVPNISVGGHLGGLVVGGAVGWALARNNPTDWGPPRPEHRYQDSSAGL